MRLLRSFCGTPDESCLSNISLPTSCGMMVRSHMCRHSKNSQIRIIVSIRNAIGICSQRPMKPRDPIQTVNSAMYRSGGAGYYTFHKVGGDKRKITDTLSLTSHRIDYVLPKKPSPVAGARPDFTSQ